VTDARVTRCTSARTPYLRTKCSNSPPGSPAPPSTRRAGA
jgi:hypothetical protein